MDGFVAEDTNFMRQCCNCSRTVQGEGVESSAGLYCGKDCFWSASLDVSNSRFIKKKKSAAPVPHRRPAHRSNEHYGDENKMSGSLYSVPRKSSLQSDEITHAMFEFDVQFLYGHASSLIANNAASRATRY
ncbi:hypothetical protein FVE85_2982 [Porphyridium purpureum]|uniref:FLZ-type domain-containing protein n=1 Tax=Porphyridium purpureum TaxID=35688 RepID=A0A5J4YTB3_PORPP|nr:hypothetical protein FVE85_2982 [Porphyridium purpureum]|eukprot:POR1640..scf227_4